MKHLNKEGITAISLMVIVGVGIAIMLIGIVLTILAYFKGG